MGTSVEHIDNLILKYVRKTISHTEMDELLRWVEESAEHKAYFKELSCVLHATNDPEFDFDLQKGLAQILNAKTAPKHFRLKTNLLAMVASVALIICVGVYFLTDRVPSTTTALSIISASDSIITVKLDDNTLITLPKGTVATKPRTFASAKREIKLSGRAFFEVAKDAQRPFIIKAGNTEVVVLGTAFEVYNNQEDSTVKVSVLSGVVKVNSPTSGFERKLTALHQIALDNAGVLKLDSILPNDNYFNWRKKILIFDATPMKDVAPDLSALYSKKVIVRNKEIENLKITTRLFNIKEDEMIYIFENSLQVKVKQSRDSLIFYR